MKLTRLARQFLEKILDEVGYVSLSEALFLIRCNFPGSWNIADQITDFIEDNPGSGQKYINEILYSKPTPKNLRI